MNNAVKYSGAQKLELSSNIKIDQLHLAVRDFGKGFNINEVKKGNGINNMQQRTKDLNGIISMNTISGSGASVILVLQL